MSRLTLVTGAGGFVGRHVVGALLRRGERVRGLDLSFPAPLAEGAEAVEGSILDPDLMARATRGVDAVIHCAAAAHLRARRPLIYHRVNARGTCEVLIAARRAKARMVHVSSHVTLVGGPDRGETTLDETVELPPSAMPGPCPRTKREAELFALSAARMGQEVVIAMPSTPVGPGDRNRTPATRMIRDVAAGRTPALLDCLLNLVDVRSLAEGIVAARDRGRSGQRYLLTGEDVAMADLAARVAALAGAKARRHGVPRAVALGAARVESLLGRLTGRGPMGPLTGVRLAGRRVRFSNARARAELGFAPAPLDTALADAISWMREEALLPR